MSNVKYLLLLFIDIWYNILAQRVCFDQQNNSRPSTQ